MNLFKLNDALSLLKDQYSCLKHVHHKILVPLPPSHINKVGNGIKRVLNDNAINAAKKLSGYPLAGGKIRVLSSMGSTFQDEASVWVPVSMEFVIFVPQQGKRVRATVSKLGKKHIGCLIHQRFNAAFHRDTVAEKYSNFTFKLGQTVILEINDYEVVEQILQIKARLVEIEK